VTVLQSQPLPLRLSTIWGGYRKVTPIPHRYGTTGGALVQYSADRKVWVWADHASLSVDEVTVDGLVVGGWIWRNGVDTSGHAVTFVEFYAAVAETSTPAARGRGKMHADSGALMTNPAAIVFDVLANIAGNPIEEAVLDGFRADCAKLGLLASGSIERSDSAQTIVRALCTSIGAIYSATMRGLCRVWPGGDPQRSRQTIDAPGWTLSKRAQRGDLCNDLTMSYDYQDGTPRATIQFQCPESIRQFGLLSATLEAPWIGSGRVASDVAARILAQRARPQYAVSAAGKTTRVRCGDTVLLAHPRMSGVSEVVQAISANTVTEACSLSLMVAVGDVPGVVLIRQASAYSAQGGASVTIGTLGEDRILRIIEPPDPNNPDAPQVPIPNAACQLDRGITRLTDATGTVNFPLSYMPTGSGQHEIMVTTADVPPRVFPVYVTV
jgi:hypothetical protein